MAVSLKKHYLSMMKIPSWRLREKSASSVCFQYRLLNLQEKKRGWLVADSSSDAAEIEKETQLIQAIAKAIKVNLQEENYSGSIDPEIVILMGKKAQAISARFQLSKTSRIISTYSPAELLKQPKLKAETWKLLQPLIPLFEAL